MVLAGFGFRSRSAQRKAVHVRKPRIYRTGRRKLFGKSKYLTGQGKRKAASPESAFAGRVGESPHRNRRSKKSGQAVGSSDRRGSQRGEVIMTALDQLRPLIGMKRACQALSVPRATWYRRWKRRGLFPAAPPSVQHQRHSARALSDGEQSSVLACLHEERFQDCSPAQVYAALLDEGRFHCSIRTMYRLLKFQAARPRTSLFQWRPRILWQVRQRRVPE